LCGAKVQVFKPQIFLRSNISNPKQQVTTHCMQEILTDLFVHIKCQFCSNYHQSV